MPTTYETVRDRISALLLSVPGIGKVYKTTRFVFDWGTFLDLNVSGGVVNVCWFDRVSNHETPAGIGSEDERNLIQWIEGNEEWEITLFYGFKDAADAGAPSTYAFQNLVGAIMEKFRFQQDLGIPTVIFRSFPLMLRDAALFQFAASTVLCHKAVFRLRLQYRIENPSADA